MIDGLFAYLAFIKKKINKEWVYFVLFQHAELFSSGQVCFHDRKGSTF